MFGVNSIQSTDRTRSRSLCVVQNRRSSRDADTFRSQRKQRSCSLKPLAFSDLLPKSKDRSKKVTPRAGHRHCSPVLVLMMEKLSIQVCMNQQYLGSSDQIDYELI